MFDKFFSVKVISVFAVVTVLIAGFFTQAKSISPSSPIFDPGPLVLDHSNSLSNEFNQDPEKFLSSESKRRWSKENSSSITNTNDHYVKEGQRNLSPDVTLRDGFHVEIGNRTTVNYN